MRVTFHFVPASDAAEADAGRSARSTRGRSHRATARA
jgi:hypothetical protein